jgi:hypothetical protein
MVDDDLAGGFEARQGQGLARGGCRRLSVARARHGCKHQNRRQDRRRLHARLAPMEAQQEPRDEGMAMRDGGTTGLSSAPRPWLSCDGFALDLVRAAKITANGKNGRRSS